MSGNERNGQPGEDLAGDHDYHQWIDERMAEAVARFDDAAVLTEEADASRRVAKALAALRAYAAALFACPETGVDRERAELCSALGELADVRELARVVVEFDPATPAIVMRGIRASFGASLREGRR